MLFKSDTIVKLLNKIKGKDLDGYTIFFFIFVKSNASKMMIEHEKVHVKQFFKTFGLFPFLYMIPSFRYKFEVEAYRKSIELGMDPWKAAWYIITQYNIDKSLQEVTGDLTK